MVRYTIIGGMSQIKFAEEKGYTRYQNWRYPKTLPLNFAFKKFKYKINIFMYACGWGGGILPSPHTLFLE